MTDFGIGSLNPTIRPRNAHRIRTGGGGTEPAAKGGKTSDPVDPGSLTAATTTQQDRSTPDVQAPVEGRGNTGDAGTAFPRGTGPAAVGIRDKGRNIDVLS